MRPQWMLEHSESHEDSRVPRDIEAQMDLSTRCYL
jgi:hypothetical protein